MNREIVSVFLNFSQVHNDNARMPNVQRVKIRKIGIYFCRKFITHVFVHKLRLVMKRGRERERNGERIKMVVRHMAARVSKRVMRMKGHRPLFGLWFFPFLSVDVLSVIKAKHPWIFKYIVCGRYSRAVHCIKYINNYARLFRSALKSCVL